jgi:hypothetical protein
MKRTFYSVFAVAILVFFQTNLRAQDGEEASTLFGDGTTVSTDDLGFFVAPAFGLTQMDGSSASLFNLRGGLNVKDAISVGAYFSTSINQIVPESETVQDIYMDYWTVGGFAEYTVLSKKLVHLTFPLYVGYGEVQMDNENGDAALEESNFFQIEPSALLEVNLHKYIRLNIGAGYRIVGDMTYRNFDQSDLSGLTGYFGLKFGLFK